jgi:hypothetical protein
MKISSILHDLLVYRADHADTSYAWADDPYAHPEISAMSERERADLPPTHMPSRITAGGGAGSRVPASASLAARA